MGWWSRFVRAEEAESPPEEGESYLVDLIRDAGMTMTRQTALAIPAFSSCVSVVKDTVAALPVRLYRRQADGDAIELRRDPRVALLNGDSGDTLTSPEILAAMVEDYYCADNGGYMFVDRVGNSVRSLRYVKSECVTPLEDSHYDPIFKRVGYLVQGKRYHDFDFVRIVRSTRDGRRGTSIIRQNNDALTVAYKTMLFERSLVSNGGNKRGFLQSAHKLGESALKKLKHAWRRFYGSTDESVVILNDGVTFQEATATSTELQLNENKQTNAQSIYAMFKIPEEIIKTGSTSNASRDARENFAQFCLMPLLKQLTASMNRNLLLESEKETHFFAFDLSELTKATMKERWESWAIAKKNGILLVDEIRARENLPKLGLGYLNLGLNDVLFDPETHEMVIPNMGKTLDTSTTVDIDDAAKAEGGDLDASEDD